MRLVVFTDLDATLLDAETYSWSAASPALAALKQREAILILVSSKTLPEMELIHRDLGIADPFIIENGGGIALTPGSPITEEIQDYVVGEQRRVGHWILIPLGTEYTDLVKILNEISAEVGCPLTGFADMTDKEVADLTGLGMREASMARQRLFDEPFVLGGTIERENEVREAAASRGLTVVQGGRFWHLIGHAGKARAVGILIECYRRLLGEIQTVGLGDSPNDFPFLEIVDTAFILGGAGQSFSQPEAPQTAQLTQKSGPEGWNEAIMLFLSRADG